MQGARMIVRAVIFDCDGVLADTEPLHLQVFNQVLAPLGITITPAAYAAHYLGSDDREAFRCALTRHGIAASGARIAQLTADKAVRFREILAANVRIYPGVVPFVASLAGRAAAVASGAHREEIDIVLRRAGLADAFAAVVAAEDVRAGKPDPEPFLTARARLDHSGRALAPAECLVVEDSVVGVTAAGRAGMRCLAVTNSYDSGALAAADLVVPSLEGLTLDDVERRLDERDQPFISRKR
jgi:beta-phosphoglucomutase